MKVILSMESGLLNSVTETRGVTLGLWNDQQHFQKGMGAGVVNTGGSLYGFHVATLNMISFDTIGFQAAIVNFAPGDMIGFQPAWFANAAGNMYGVQIAGGGNIAEKAMSGFQAGLIANVSEGDLIGFQVAGIGANIAKRDMRGIQLVFPLGYNIAGQEMEGFQGSLLTNVSEFGLEISENEPDSGLDGFSVAIVNYSEECNWFNPLVGGFCLFGKSQ